MTDRAYYFHYTKQIWLQVENEADIGFIHELGLICVYAPKRPTKRHYEIMMKNMFHRVCDLEDIK